MQGTGVEGCLDVPVWNYILFQLGYFMVVLNSSLNFVIYCWVGTKFRADLLDTITWIWEALTPGPATSLQDIRLRRKTVLRFSQSSTKWVSFSSRSRSSSEASTSASTLRQSRRISRQSTKLSLEIQLDIHPIQEENEVFSHAASEHASWV